MTDDWTPDAAGTRIVLFGADTFRSRALSELPAVRNNLTDLAHALTGSPHGLLADHPANRTVLGLDERADQGAVGDKITAASEQAEELLLVYYSGHGVLDVDGKLHLALPDTDPTRPGYTALPLDLIKRDLAGARARARVLVLDCCFSGRAINTMAATEQLVAAELTLTGTYILASTSANKPSLVLPGQRNTAFTGALLRALGEPEPLTLDEIYRRTDAELGGLGLPRPRCASTDAGRRLVLTRGPVPEHADNVVPRRRRNRWFPVASAVVLAGAVWAGSALPRAEDEASPPPTTPAPRTSEANAAPPAPPPPQVRRVEELTVAVQDTGTTPDGAITIGVTAAVASENVNGSKTVAGGGGEGEGGGAVAADEPSPGAFIGGFTEFYLDTAMRNCTARNLGIGDAVVTGTPESWVKVVVSGFNLPGPGSAEKVSVTFRVEQGTGELPESDQLCL